MLLFLSAGVLAAGGAPLRQLTEVLRLDKASGDDRLVCAHSEWKFGCAEQQAASANVQAALSQHEAITHRPQDDGGRSRHEFPAMVSQLVKMLGMETLAPVAEQRPNLDFVLTTPEV